MNHYASNTFGPNLDFDVTLEKGKQFEDLVEPLINQYFGSLDPNAMYMNKAYSKKDIKHGRGQRYKSCVNPNISFSAPDIEMHCLGKQLHVEIKYKERWVNFQGKEYGIVDEYRIQHYKDVLDVTNFDACLIVFGCGTTRKVYIVNVNDYIKKKLPFMRTDRNNPTCTFACWDVEKMKCIGSF